MPGVSCKAWILSAVVAAAVPQIRAQNCESIRRQLDEDFDATEKRYQKSRTEIIRNEVCSRCKRTRSQIEHQEGVSYSAHLSMVQGVNEISEYTRLDATTTLEACYQSQLSFLEESRLRFLKICGDLNNKSYLKKTAGYQQQNESIQGQTQNLQQSTAGKPVFNPNAANAVSFDDPPPEPIDLYQLYKDVKSGYDYIEDPPSIGSYVKDDLLEVIPDETTRDIVDLTVGTFIEEKIEELPPAGISLAIRAHQGFQLYKCLDGFTSKIFKKNVADPINAQMNDEEYYGQVDPGREFINYCIPNVPKVIDVTEKLIRLKNNGRQEVKLYVNSKVQQFSQKYPKVANALGKLFQ